MAPVVGTGIGTYLSENTSDDKEAIENDLPLQVLQGIPQYAMMTKK